MAGLDEIARRGGKPTRGQSTAIFQLVASQYQHALFHRWERDAGPALLREIKELKLDDDNAAMGLQWFLSSRRTAYLPAMIGSALEGVADLLDPALTDPDTEVQATKNTRFALRELDVRFSRSVLEGLDYIRKLHVVSRLEWTCLSVSPSSTRSFRLVASDGGGRHLPPTCSASFATLRVASCAVPLARGLPP